MLAEPQTAGTVFLSYASQDAAAAERICAALRAAGVAVWLDKNELAGGDAWDAQIKKRIQECSLFIPVISAHTNARSEGYFRGEWNLAIRRLMNMAQDAAFIVPVVIDETREATARVPEEFLRAQWTWVPTDDKASAFAQRVRQLLDGDMPPTQNPAAATTRAHAAPPRKARTRRLAIAAAAALLVLGGAGWWYYHNTRPAHEVAASQAFSPPPHSVAVLAFLNLSGDP